LNKIILFLTLTFISFAYNACSEDEDAGQAQSSSLEMQQNENEISETEKTYVQLSNDIGYIMLNKESLDTLYANAINRENISKNECLLRFEKLKNEEKNIKQLLDDVLMRIDKFLTELNPQNPENEQKILFLTNIKERIQYFDIQIKLDQLEKLCHSLL